MEKFAIIEIGSISTGCLYCEGKVWDTINISIIDNKTKLITRGVFTMRQDDGGRYIDFTKTKFKTLGIIYLVELRMAV